MTEELTELRSLGLELEDQSLNGWRLSGYIYSQRKAQGIHGDLARFLADWQSPSPTVKVQTSGSTGEPKSFLAEKVRMAQSARKTCAFFGLKAGDTALLAMPLKYIGAKMMVVRALVQGLRLIVREPSASPLQDYDGPLDFAPLTPMQVFDSLQDSVCAERLKKIRHLLLGGGAISAHLEEQLGAFPNTVWLSYAMTETLSHIALRAIGKGPWYSPLSGVHLSLSEEGTLIIDAPSICTERLVTKDRAELDGTGRFRILGRLDNVINSGGIKIQIEEAERLLEQSIDGPFCLTSVPDERLGQKAVLLYEEEQEGLEAVCKEILPRYWSPKLFFQIPRLPRTGNGKIARAEARALALSRICL